MPSQLLLIATPIGNLNDISARALDALKSSDILFCEDTRTTRVLLERYGISVPLDSYREQAHGQKTRRVLEFLRDGKTVGLVSDAGTPGVSDPGGRLVRDVLDALPDVAVVPIPGPCAAVAAYSASGFPSGAFTFLGFPPHKKGRNAFFREALAYPHPVVLYESPHRIMKALSAIAEIAPDRSVAVFRELTKVHETSYRGTASEVATAIANGGERGEFVVVIEG